MLSFSLRCGLLFLGVLICLSGCGTLPECSPESAVAVEAASEEPESLDLNLLKDSTLGGAPGESLPSYWPMYPLGVIGEVEPVYFEPFDEPFFARVDFSLKLFSSD